MSLEYHDMKDQLEPVVSIDEYAAKMGPDHEIVTISFIVKSKLVGEDLVSWFEKGYDFVLDASVSDGELEPGKFVVFVEIDRRSKVPNRIIRILEELQTLTDLDITDWEVMIDGNAVEATEDAIREKIILNPNTYKEEKNKESELNEMRIAAGIDAKKIYNEKDTLLKDFIAAAGL